MSFFGFGNGAGDRIQFRHFSTNLSNGSLKKTQFYVWFLGSKPSQGLRGREYVLPTVRELIDEGGRHPPPCKVTVQISAKGMKIVQSVPQLSRRTGKLKMESMKLIVPPQSITYSSIGPRPYTDVVSCILLLWNPDTRCPVHVHVYRCDSPETASIMHSALQMLVDRPENQRALMEVERRLTARGLLVLRGYRDGIQRRQKIGEQENRLENGNENSKSIRAIDDGPRSFYESPADYDVANVRDSRIVFPNGQNYVKNGFSNQRQSRSALLPNQMSPIMERDESSERVSRLHKAVFSELKEKLQSKGPLLLPPKDYSLRFVKSGLPAHFLAAAWSINDRSAISTSGNSRVLDYSKFDHYAMPPQAESNRRPATILPHAASKQYASQNLKINSPTSTLNSSETVVDSGEVRRKLRLFGDTVRMKIDNKDNENRFLDEANRSRSGDYGRLASSSVDISIPRETDNGISYDGNWVITKPHFSSMQNLRNDQEMDIDERGVDRAIDSRLVNGNESANSSCSLPRDAPRKLRRTPNPVVVCDPFGRKYERRTTVKNFWKNVQMPTRVEDNYGLWYVAPSNYCFP